MGEDIASANGVVAPSPDPPGLNSYIIGLVGLALGAGFYGVLFCVLLIAWALRAPSAPTGPEGAAIFCAAAVHIAPLVL